MAKTMTDVETQMHLIIKGLRNSADKRMMVCSSADRAQIVEAILAAGFGLVADAKAEAWDEGKNAVWTFMSNQDPRRDRPANPYRTVS